MIKALEADTCAVR